MNNRWDRDNRNPLPKPYDFVPITDDERLVHKPRGHHAYFSDSISGKIEATIVAHSPIHVSTGLLEPSNDPKFRLVKSFFRSQGKPVIPGSSLKGCIRSITEAITRSTIPHKDRDSKVASRYMIPKPQKHNEKPSQLDIASQLFGMMNYQGLVTFYDAVLENQETEIQPSIQLFKPDLKARHLYFDGNEPKGRKFYMHGTVAEGTLPLEVCPIDSCFKVEIDFKNLSEDELGLLIISLGKGNTAFFPKLGGGKPACLGTIEFTDLMIYQLDKDASYKGFDLTYEQKELGPFINAGEQLVLGKQLEKLAEILRWPRPDRNCPDRTY
jgi:CRISPR/Cas system CSM-associated protein Csm3 (group 7 of RAMP superfamily)